jgi:endonuclease/exonuclease/phosphatase family metal-dependent hydrolase
VSDGATSEGATSEGASASIRVAFWNAWLLHPRFTHRRRRLPDWGGWFAPHVDRRAPLVAEAVKGRFDVVALGECFERSEQRAVSDAWHDASLVPGPQRFRRRHSTSGLATLVDRHRVELVRVAELHYHRVGDLRDSDVLASKGALLTAVRIHPDLPPVEVVSTHLFAGGELLPLPGARDQARHHAARMAQVDELVGFIGREHDPASPLLVVGDFNVAAHDPDPTLPDPTVRYRDLAHRLEWAGLRDLWADHGVGPGPTCSFTDEAHLPQDPEEPDRVADDPDGHPLESPGERIDYLWLATPDGLTVEVERPRRWAFHGRDAVGGPAGSLSDHLALSVTLHVSR